MSPACVEYVPFDHTWNDFLHFCNTGKYPERTLIEIGFPTDDAASMDVNWAIPCGSGFMSVSIGDV